MTCVRHCGVPNGVEVPHAGGHAVAPVYKDALPGSARTLDIARQGRQEKKGAAQDDGGSYLPRPMEKRWWVTHSGHALTACQISPPICVVGYRYLRKDFSTGCAPLFFRRLFALLLFRCNKNTPLFTTNKCMQWLHIFRILDICSLFILTCDDNFHAPSTHPDVGHKKEDPPYRTP
jgi:hypothetical protein